MISRSPSPSRAKDFWIARVLGLSPSGFGVAISRHGGGHTASGRNQSARSHPCALACCWLATSRWRPGCSRRTEAERSTGWGPGAARCARRAPGHAAARNANIVTLLSLRVRSRSDGGRAGLPIAARPSECVLGSCPSLRCCCRSPRPRSRLRDGALAGSTNGRRATCGQN